MPCGNPEGKGGMGGNGAAPPSAAASPPSRTGIGPGCGGVVVVPAAVDVEVSVGTAVVAGAVAELAAEELGAASAAC